jgi:methylated-DNA-protein-cysteine methyltransferase-like protein
VSSGFFEKVWEMVARIPKGKVASYGQIAAMVGNPRAARTVGWALHSIPEEMQLPWHRVINSKGEISWHCREHEVEIQRVLLEKDGVKFDEHGRINMSHYQWCPELDDERDFNK